MATKAKVVSLIQKNYPKYVGALKMSIVNCIGPTDYDTPGVQVDFGRYPGVRYIHSVKCSGGLGAAGARYLIVPIFDSTKPIDTKTSPTNFTLVFLLIAANGTSAEPADNADLSAVKFQLEILGTH